MQNSEYLYAEEVTSRRTILFFVFLASFFLALAIRRLDQKPLDGLSFTTGLCAFLFVFYAINFRVLSIRISGTELSLRFGLFTWMVPIENIKDVRLDHLPFVMRYGGAGVHFMMIRKRYRVSFNLLEHPRVVAALKRKKGPVQDVSFSTCHPDEVVAHIKTLIQPMQST